jgi:excinuclease ABC subunit B
LYSEFKEFFPYNAVHYFVSYYDYYQPEAYIPQRDIYIEKDASINDEIDRLRLATTSALVSRRDVLMVASVSSIYGLGSPEDYRKMMVAFERGEMMDRDEMLGSWSTSNTNGTTRISTRGKFRVRGDCVEFGPGVRRVRRSHRVLGRRVEQITHQSGFRRGAGQDSALFIYPAKHFVTPEERMADAVVDQDRIGTATRKVREQGKLLEAQRLNARTRFDIEMLQEVGHCPGIENYSRHLAGRSAGETPETLYNFFPKDFCC